MKKKAHGKYSDTHSHGRIWLGKRRDNGKWYIRCPVPNSPKVIFQSLGTTQKSDAIKQADLLYQQVVNRRYRIADGTITLRLLFDKYLEAKSGRIKIKSFKRVQTTIASFMGWLDTTHSEVVLTKHLTPELVREFQKRRETDGLSLRSVNNDVKNLHSVFKWAMREDMVGRSPADYSKNSGTIDLFKLPPNERDVYTEQEYDALVAEADRRGLGLIRDLVIVFAGTGMRFEELARLWRSHVHWNTTIPTIEVRAHGGWTPKDPREVKLIPMLPEVQAVVRRWWDACRNDTDFLFQNTVENKIHEGWTREKLQSLFPAVGIGENRRLFWHSFRNFFIIRCLKKGVIVPALMKWTGHDSATMVLHYASVIQQGDVFAEFKKVS